MLLSDPHTIAAITTGSIIMGISSAIATPWILLRLPADYFRQEKPHLIDRLRHATLATAVLLMFKNIAGLLLLFVGVLMLVLPGQGLVTIVLSLILIDFPKKFHAERWFVRRGKILATINWMRQRQGRMPLDLGPH